MFLDTGKCFWILGRVLDSGKCFWILGSVLNSGKCFVPMSHGRIQLVIMDTQHGVRAAPQTKFCNDWQSNEPLRGLYATVSEIQHKASSLRHRPALGVRGEEVLESGGRGWEKREEGFSPFAFSLLSSYPQETPNTQGKKRPRQIRYTSSVNSFSN